MSATPISGRPLGRHINDLTPRAARLWWVFLITGTLWLIFSLIVFRFDLKRVR